MKQVLIRRGAPVVVDVPAPQLTENCILVEVHSSLISSGTEMAGLDASPKSIVREALQHPAKVAKGLKMVREAGLQRTMALVNTEIDFGFPAGYSCAGTVMACGNRVNGFKTGDRVACAGAGRANHAEIVSIPQNLAVHVPEGCDMESAASATLGAIAVQGIRRADTRFGEYVTVIGLGLIGQITVQLLKVAGCRTLGIDIDQSRVNMAVRLGSEASVNSQDADPVRAVMEFTSGAGADAVIITASASAGSLVQQAMQMVRRKGKVVVVGAVPLELQRSPFYEKEADLLISCSYGPGRYDLEYEERGLDYPYGYVRWTENRNMAEYLRLVADGRIDFKCLIQKTWPMDQAAEAYKDLRENRHIAVLLSVPKTSHGPKSTSRVDIRPADKQRTGQLRVGIVGAGSFLRSVHLPNLKRMAEDYTVSGIVSRTGSTAWSMARQYGARYASTDMQDLLNDPDIDLIMIGTRHNLHAKQAMDAARKGKSVFLEKPAALHSGELNELVKTISDTGTYLMVGFNRRFSPLARSAKELADSRSNPLVISYRVNAGPAASDSWIQGAEGGGRIIGEACHIFDLFNYLVGADPVEVVALPLHASVSHIATTDNFTASVRYSDGSLCTLTYTSLGSADLPKEYMEVFFDGKTLVMDDYRKLSFFGISAKPIARSQQDKGHAEELRQLAAYLHGNGPAPMSLEEIETATRTSFIVDQLVRNGGMSL